MIGLGGSSHEATGCHLFRDAAACVSRERVARSRPLCCVYSTRMAEVGVCVAPEPHGLGEGRPNACAMVVACTVVGPVAVGCSWARYTVIYGRTIFFRFLDSCNWRYNHSSV